jgi:hypothetical protein
MEAFNNFSEVFLSVWNKGILGVDIFQILIGIGIFFIFLIFRGIISKLIIKKLEIISNFFITNLLINPLKIKNIKKITIPINI